MNQTTERNHRFADLMRSVQGGDRSAYAQLLREVTPLLRNSIRRQCRYLQPQDIEDLVQDTLLSLHVVRATYDPWRPFLPWLSAIARNRIADGARRYARRVANEMAVEKLPETFSGHGTNMFEETYGDPEALLQAIRRLPRGQRSAIEMLKLRELSLKEAAEISGMSVSTLKVALHRAVKALRTTLRKEA